MPRAYRVIYPARGLIYDRNGEIMVYNQAAYDIMVTPRLLEPFDTTELCEILKITQGKCEGKAPVGQVLFQPGTLSFYETGQL